MVILIFRASIFWLLTISSIILFDFAIAAPSSISADTWPYQPFVTQGKDIKNTQDKNVVYAGVNWPGAGDVMIPEGLQYQSVESIVSKIKSLGMNSIRLTYAIEMIDQVYTNDGKDIPIQKAFISVLGQTNGTKVFNQVIAKNPSFTASTTRLQVFDAIAEECAKQEILVHLDNHMSKGAWCCNTEDGNSWFGDTYFSVANWTRGLGYIANRGKSWRSLVSMSLRNELRTPDNKPTLANASYNWQDWYKYIKQGTNAINSANGDVLIFLSGLDFDTYMTPVVRGTTLTPGTATFNPADFAGYRNKLVIEIHNYNNDATSCTSLQSNLYNSGFQAMHPDDSATKNVFPVALTEFGFSQDATEWKRVYGTCIASYLSAQKGSWMQWVISGSYYIRSGTQDYEETWGLLSHDWSAWRSPSYIEGGLKTLVKNTVSS